ncbi:MAG: hypothetical protein WAL80_20305 [Xanthobacteraceae bacterium]
MVRIPKPLKKIAKRQLDLRARLWPELQDGDLWSRHTHDGFSTIPSTMPLVMSIMDDLSKNRPVSSTYLELWMRGFDDGFATLAKAREIAFHSGFSTERAERTWKSRLKILHELGFINLKGGASGDASYALILNPYKVIQKHHDKKTSGMREDKYNALVARALEIGDVSLAPPAPAVAATPVPAPFPFPMPDGYTPPVIPVGGAALPEEPAKAAAQKS